MLEARTLARFDHPNVVRTRSFFEQNGTAYLVMDYLQGVNLTEYLASKGGRLTEQQAAEIMLPILDGLQEVHAKGFLHRDIKPQNIYITTIGRPILLDFGAARQAMGERSRSLSVVLTQGFAPYEQYHRRGEQGPWTDIYAVSATYYYLLSGQAPPDAAERVAIDELKPIDAVVPGISANLSAAIMQGLSLEAGLRPQDVFMFRDMLAGKNSMPKEPTVSVKAPPAAVPPPLPPLPKLPIQQMPEPVMQPSPAAAPAYSAPPAYTPPPAYSAPPVQEKKSSSGIWIAITAHCFGCSSSRMVFLRRNSRCRKKRDACSYPTG